MEIDFEGLLELQRLDSEIQAAAEALEAIPRLLETIDKKSSATDCIVTASREKLTLNQKKRRDLEGGIKDLKTVIAKFKRQLNEVKSNKEYTALLKEIEETQSRIDGLEESIIAEMINADDIEGEIKTSLHKKTQEEESLNKEKKSLQDKVREIQGRQDGLVAEKQALLPKIDKDLFALYDNIFKKRGGLAISPLKGEFCSLCHMRIRPQMINEVIARKELILCENCGRILYCPEDEKAAAAPKAGSPEQAKGN